MGSHESIRRRVKKILASLPEDPSKFLPLADLPLDETEREQVSILHAKYPEGSLPAFLRKLDTPEYNAVRAIIARYSDYVPPEHDTDALERFLHIDEDTIPTDSSQALKVDDIYLVRAQYISDRTIVARHYERDVTNSQDVETVKRWMSTYG